MDIKTELLNEISRRNLDITFDDIDEVVNGLRMLVNETHRTQSQLIDEYIQYCLDNWED